MHVINWQTPYYYHLVKGFIYLFIFLWYYILNKLDCCNIGSYPNKSKARIVVY